MLLLFLLLIYTAYSSCDTSTVGLMTNDDKTGCNFTCIEKKRISQTEDATQVLKSKHAHVSQQRLLNPTPTLFNTQCGSHVFQKTAGDILFLVSLLWLKREKNRYSVYECSNHMRSNESEAEAGKQVQTTCYCNKV